MLEEKTRTDIDILRLGCITEMYSDHVIKQSIGRYARPAFRPTFYYRITISIALSSCATLMTFLLYKKFWRDEAFRQRPLHPYFAYLISIALPCYFQEQ